MTAADEILAKMDACKPYYERLVGLRPELAKAAPDDWRLWILVERLLHLAVECAIDSGEMTISWKRWELAQENRDVFRILGEHAVLSPALAQRMMKAAGLRNALVHRYGEIDQETVRKAVLVDLADLDEYAKAIARFVRGPP